MISLLSVRWGRVRRVPDVIRGLAARAGWPRGPGSGAGAYGAGSPCAVQREAPSGASDVARGGAARGDLWRFMVAMSERRGIGAQVDVKAPPLGGASCRRHAFSMTLARRV